MSVNVIRAWKDEEYRLSLSEAERALLPANPAGLIDLTDAELSGIDGGTELSGRVCSIVSVVSLISLISFSLTASCISVATATITAFEEM
jgi:mersacidin/lichenicidin family type 2 lantibiotic